MSGEDVYDVGRVRWCNLCNAEHEPCDEPWLDEVGMSDAELEKRHANDCPECGGHGYYWAEGNPETAEVEGCVVLEVSEPFDGTVCIRCHVCDGIGKKR